MDDQTRKLLTVFSILSVLVALAVLSGELREEQQSNESFGQLDYEEANESRVKAVFVEDNTSLAELELEKADSPEERRVGLMNRTSLENGTGMIFVWNSSDERNFWMKNTYIPLDMIFISAEKTIRTIKRANPEPNVSEEDLKTYSSEGPVRYVVETNQNFTDRYGISEGDTISFNFTE